MSSALITQAFSESTPSQQALYALEKQGEEVRVNGLVGSGLSFLQQSLFLKEGHTQLLICSDKEEAAYYLNDLEQLIGGDQVLFYPASYRRPYQIEETDNANVLMRAEVLSRLQSEKKPLIVVTYPDALLEKVITRKAFEKKRLSLAVGDQLGLDFLNETLFEYAFKRVDFVTQAGEFSVRGGIVDVFSYSHDLPYRIEFFGDEIDSMRTFDVESQLSEEKVQKISLIPNVENKISGESRESFIRHLPSNALISAFHFGQLRVELDRLFQKAEEAFAKLDSPLEHTEPEDLFLNGTQAEQLWKGYTRLEWKSDKPDISWNQKPQPSFNKRFDLLLENLQQNQEEGLKNIICCATPQQAQRLADIFAESQEEVPYSSLVCPLYAGFTDPDAGIALYTDHQLFERYHKFHLKNGYAKQQAITLKELNKLEMGDYVTHIDHGIGKFGGLQKIDVEGKKQEAIKLIYGDRDILYVSIHSLHKISKYNGKDGTTPKLFKLGSAAWKKLKQKTKSRVKKIAFNLIQVYAKRRMRKGFQYAPDTYLQHELEASFVYEDTPDQEKATQDVKRDMENERPMDRLICGDVGFGKTEIAIRAAFKAVDNGKQVAILVPTTILAFQHANTFKKRMADLPVNIDYLNRFRTTKEKNDILERLEMGRLDIIIGTHQLVSKKVKFKDLGLLIVDEEQKFGVAVKDKLKSIKENVDVLTLTATPIPRTLQFSLMAARDLSVINTPPPNRFPIESRVIRLQEEIIRDGISYEIQRGGQVFFIHNRVENIQEVAGMIQRLVPDAKVRIGHGQMDGKKLEELMLDFMDGRFDVLVSTTIVESGLDVSNANTIFIHNAHQFGLSDLHQMRGRVGRSNKKAFCYFITPGYESMTTEARKRIEALEQFTDLGSGFNIAMKDLEIRGAGDLLGGEQSGFINEIGFETYQKILSEAIEELKDNEFKELYEEVEGSSVQKEFIKDTQLDTDFELLFPDSYINNISERLTLYTDLNEVKDESGLEKFRQILLDRFGPLPAEAEDLLNSVRIKWIATHLGLERVIMKKGKFLGYFIADQQSDFYQSPRFTQVLHYVQSHPKKLELKEKQTRNGLRLLLVIDEIRTLSKALQALQPLAPALYETEKAG